jgi:hypothetical protein
MENMMKLSKETTEVLKNFSTINMSILFKVGQQLKTVSPQKTVMAIANISETLPLEFAVYDLNKFLGTLSMFEDPDLAFGEKQVRISNGTGAVASLTYASKEAIVSAPDKDVTLPSAEINVSLEEKALTSALRAAGVMGLPELCFVGRDGQTLVTACDTNNDSADGWEMPVGTSDANYKMIFRLDNLKLLPRDYDVIISSKGIAKFSSKKNDVTYFVATETGSKYAA